MNKSKLPTEVELIYEVMPCSAMRSAFEPANQKHPCTYFKKWGNYHSYDYTNDGAPVKEGIEHPSKYVGLAPLSPEVLSGCRKSPIMAIGINPNLPGFFEYRKNSAYPLFDDYKQYAHYFRFRATDKLEIEKEAFNKFNTAPEERPPQLTTDLEIPDNRGEKIIPLQKQKVTFYKELQSLLDDFSEAMNWQGANLEVSEDLAYLNMVACPSAVWMTRPRQGYPKKLVMSNEETKGIIQECFHDRKYFLRQFFQSLPKVILVISNTTARAFITEMKDYFIMGNPKISENIDELMQREHVLKFGQLVDGTELIARVIFSHHITGNSKKYKEVRGNVLTQLINEGENGNLTLNPDSGHLSRSKGACVFCPMLEIGQCDYEKELVPLSKHPQLTSKSSNDALLEEKKLQLDMLQTKTKVVEAEATRSATDLQNKVWQEDEDDYRTLNIQDEG